MLSTIFGYSSSIICSISALYCLLNSFGIGLYSANTGRLKNITNIRHSNFFILKLYDNLQQQKEQAVGSERKTKIGTGDRSEKIRTYNYPQNRVTDHRIGFSVMSLDRVMDGELEPIIDALITEDLKRKLAGE